jgi:hypothetical protein
LSNNQSNIDVAKMAQNYATTGLGAQRAGYQANADTARTTAMNELMGRINDARYGVEEGVGNRKTALEESIIGAGGAVDGSIAAPVDARFGRGETTSTPKKPSNETTSTPKKPSKKKVTPSKKSSSNKKG